MLKNYTKFTALAAFFLSLNASAQLNVYSEDFAGGIGAWSAVDVNDASSVWAAAGGYMEINGAGGSDDEDWLISPAINMDAQTDEYFLFDYNDVNDGNLIELYFSTNYNGGGTPADVASASWTALPLDVLDLNAISCFTNLFQRHPAIDVSGINGSSVYFGFKFTSTGGAARQYQIDNVHIEAEYYNSIHASVAAGVRCAQLKTEIHDIIVNQTKVQYTSTNFDIWDSQLQTDHRMNDAGTAMIVWDMFTDIPSGTGEFEFDHCLNRDQGSCPGGEGICYNREHTFPQSWWGGGQTAADTQFVDLHHIVPADRSLNTAKSNNPPGVVTTPTTTGSNGLKVGFNPSYPCPSATYWEPIDEYKGDYARIFLYFATRYEHNMTAWSTIAAGGDCAMNGDPFTSYEPWLVQVLLDWNAADPVSQKEIDRNNAIFAMQGNRNPYVDNPEWIELIWGDVAGNPCATIGIDEVDANTALNVYPNPSADGIFTVDVEDEIKHIELVDLAGRTIQIETNIVTGEINASKLNKGTYILRVETATGFYTKEVVIGY